ncbi:response regulator transcription factor [Pseudonocardia sp. T1-2H]|uniref:response regulator transcription factor n=1 Tax=Pseudonocardia sp. T1-2H TaxID=3128899 RepID=UPI0031016F8E
MTPAAPQSSPPPPAPAQPSWRRVRPGRRALSKREREVLTLVVQGLTNKEIGGRLFLSEDTVKTHVRRIIAALEAKDRTNAAALAVHRRLLPDLQLQD